MNLDRARADSQFRRDFTIVQPVGNAVKHFVLAWRQVRHTLPHPSTLTLTRDRLRIAGQCGTDRVEQLLRLHRFLEKINRTRQQRSACGRHVAVPGYDDHGQLRFIIRQLRLQIEAAHPRQMKIDHCACRPRTDTMPQKFFGAAKRMHAQAV